MKANSGDATSGAHADRIEPVTPGALLARQRGASGSWLAAPTTGRSRSYVGSVFARAARFDQFSTFSPLKRAKSLTFVVASTSPFT